MARFASRDGSSRRRAQTDTSSVSKIEYSRLMQNTKHRATHYVLYTAILMGICLNGAFAAEAPAGGGLLSQLGIDPKTILIQAIGFLIVLAVLWKFVFGKVGGLLDERREGIATQLEQLRTDREELDRLTAETRQRLADIETEAQTKSKLRLNRGTPNVRTFSHRRGKKQRMKSQEPEQKFSVRKMKPSPNYAVLSLSSLLMQPVKS